MTGRITKKKRCGGPGADWGVIVKKSFYVPKTEKRNPTHEASWRVSLSMAAKASG